ncbi:hypothetical protein HZB94_04755 [Candidatus Falkowbacteria bacterium]|nr:hypothetical protein [Candidatus Falkowbacteria bacterium]
MFKTKSKTKTKKTDDQCRVEILKTELHYYKGLAIVIVVLIFCVFVAFASLFSAMYLETRATRVIIEKAFSDFIPKVEVESAVPEIGENKDVGTAVGTALELSTTPIESTSKAVPAIEWLSFSKYGVIVYFPNNWTFLDKPYKKELHFFNDGVVRDNDSENIGDLSVAFTKSDSYRDKYQGTLADIAGRVGFAYKYKINTTDKQVIVVPFGKNYVEFRFKEKINDKENLSSDLISAMIDKVEIK